MAVDAGDDGVGGGELAELGGEVAVLLRVEVLGREEDDLVAQQRAAHGVDGVGVERVAEVEAVDLGADHAGEWVGCRGRGGRR